MFIKWTIFVLLSIGLNEEITSLLISRQAIICYRTHLQMFVLWLDSKLAYFPSTPTKTVLLTLVHMHHRTLYVMLSPQWKFVPGQFSNTR